MINGGYNIILDSLNSKTKPHIFLDLDNTILSSIPVEDLTKYNDILQKKTLGLKMHYMEKLYILYERPYLQEFLNFIFEHFNVSIWTAATQKYCVFIIKNMFDGRPLQNVLFSNNCTQSKRRFNDNSKDLRMLKFVYKLEDSLNCFILDDYKENVIDTQPECSLLAESFDVLKLQNPNKDYFLKRLIDNFKEILINRKIPHDLTVQKHSTVEIKPVEIKPVEIKPVEIVQDKTIETFEAKPISTIPKNSPFVSVPVEVEPFVSVPVEVEPFSTKNVDEIGDKKVTFNLSPDSRPSTPPSDAGTLLQLNQTEILPTNVKTENNYPPLPPTLSELIGKYDNLSDISSENNQANEDTKLKIIVCNVCKEKYESASGLTTKCPECRDKEIMENDDNESEEGFKIICANPNCREEYISASGTTKLCPDCR